MKKFLFTALLLSFLAGGILADSTYPQVDIDGFKKWEYKKPEVTPSRNYFTGLSNLGNYYNTTTAGPWQERLQLKILGQLSEHLSVSYDLEQQPETPEKYDVKVKYYDTELTFGDINATFSGNEFVSTSKYLNGVMLTSKSNWYDIIAVPSAKLKSQTQALTTQTGNNTKGPYNLGHGGIVENSESVQLNGVFLRRNVDYTIDYFEGKVTFNRILTSADEIKYSYEYTNILDLFFPSLSKRDFFGLQSRFIIDPEKWGKPEPKEAPIINDASENFPRVPGSGEVINFEAESSGRYQLDHWPLVKFGETLSFMGTTLKKNEDYLIRYDTGEIKLLTRFLPTTEEALRVDYRYYETSVEVDVIKGIGSRGPYRTRKIHLVPESEKIEVDFKPFVRDLDYSINYDTGELLFGTIIGPTSQITATYRYNIVSLPQAITSKFPKELKLGATFLKETAKKSAGSPSNSVIETITGQKLISSNFVVNLQNRPVVPSSEAALVVRLKQGGQSRELTREVDYTIPTTEVDPATGFVRVIPNCDLGYITDRADATDGYGTGAIYFYNQAISATDEVTVTYTYYKSIFGNYQGAGDGTRGPFYLKGSRALVPGTETVFVWDQGSSASPAIYSRNASLEGNAGDTGYSINYNTNNPSITFNKELPATKSFKVTYYYIPSQTGNAGDLSQAAYGLDAAFKIGDAFKVETAYARSESDQLFVAEATNESFTGNGSKTYSLHSPADLIEGSEKIIVGNQVLNRDSDYYVSYTKPGQFVFYYITPTTADAISVDYSYQTTSGIVVGGNVKTDSAYRLAAEAKLLNDALLVNGNTKKIGFEFSPLGGTAIGIGSEYDEYNVSYQPGVNAFFGKYAYKHNKNPLSGSRTKFNRTYDHLLSAGINPKGLVKVDFSYRTYFNIDDPGSSGLHNNDSLLDTFTAKVVPSTWSRGALSFDQSYDLRKNYQKNDYLDLGANLSTTLNDFYHAYGALKITERFSAGYDFQYQEPLTLNSTEARTSHSRQIDNQYSLNLDVTPNFMKKLAARFSTLNHDDFKYLPTPESTTSTKNETYHLDVAPLEMLTGYLDHNRQERISYVVGSENPLNLKTTGLIQATPFSWLSGSVNATKSEAIPETGSVNKTIGRTMGYDVNIIPLSLNIVKLNARFAASDTYLLAPLGTERVRTDTDTFSQNYTLGLTFIPILPLNLGLIQEDYKNYNNSVTSPVSTETQNQTITGNFTLTLPVLPQFSLSGNYNRKVTNDLLKKNSLPKTVIGGKASYQVASWGTLNYELGDEHNEGEVQSGVLVTQDLKKTTQTISLNINIPVTNPVLSGFTLIASLKTVDYTNNNNHNDDFRASLMSFEGTLNF